MEGDADYDQQAESELGLGDQQKESKLESELGLGGMNGADDEGIINGGHCTSLG